MLQQFIEITQFAKELTEICTHKNSSKIILNYQNYLETVLRREAMLVTIIKLNNFHIIKKCVK